MPDKRRQKQDLSADELARLAEITPSDIADAQQAWRDDASPAFADLLDATPAEQP